MEIDNIYYGDCLTLMPNIKSKSIDMIFCDLPYGTTRCKWDTPIDLTLLWEQYSRIIKDNGVICLFAQTPFDKVLGYSNLKILRYEWIWEKTQATGHLNANKMPMKAHENILVFYKKLPKYHPQKTYNNPPMHNYTKYLTTQNNTEIYGKMSQELSGGGDTSRYPRSIIIFASDKQHNYLHPTQKPLELCKYLIKTYTDKDDVVLDNCCGSGTIPFAAKVLGRRFIGIENDKKYYEIARKRVND